MFEVSITLVEIFKMKYVVNVYTTQGKTWKHVFDMDIQVEQKQKIVEHLNRKCVKDRSTCISYE